MENGKQNLFVAVAMLAAISAGLGLYVARHGGDAAPPHIEGLLWPNPKVLHEFVTIDQDGKPFGLDELRGKWSFLFFGYTHCPDVCPMTMAVLGQVQDELHKDPDGDLPRAVLVTIDPERDTPQQLAAYVKHFGADVIGLGGSIENVQTLAAQIGVAFYKTDAAADGGYLMDHSAGVFLIDPQGRMVGVFQAPHTAPQIVERFRAIRAFIEDNAT
jgi:protein SCO1/2